MVLINYQSLDATAKWKMVNQHDFDQTEINSANTIIPKMKLSLDKCGTYKIQLLVKEN